MGSFSNAAETNVFTYYLQTTAPTRPSTLAIALLTSAPDDTSTGQFSTTPGTEVANSNAYARVTTNVGPADANWTLSSGQATNAQAITFPQASGGSWGTITHFAIVTSGTYDSGAVVWWGALTTSKTIADGDVFVFPAGSIVITLD